MREQLAGINAATQSLVMYQSRLHPDKFHEHSTCYDSAYESDDNRADQPGWRPLRLL